MRIDFLKTQLNIKTTPPPTQTIGGEGETINQWRILSTFKIRKALR